jgi:hypothetical protein
VAGPLALVLLATDKHLFSDGDDMTMEMVTDLDDGNVDEVSFPHRLLCDSNRVLCRWKRPFHPSWPCTPTRFCPRNVF